MSYHYEVKKFQASVWQEGDWYIAQCLNVDVASQGESEAEAIESLKEALQLHFAPPTPTITPRVSTFEIEIGAA
jgi:predicted RNase H-like HicB family nuclease